MADKLIGVLVTALAEIAAKRLIGYFELENVFEIVTTFGDLALMTGAVFAWWMGWL